MYFPLLWKNTNIDLVVIVLVILFPAVWGVQSCSLLADRWPICSQECSVVTGYSRGGLGLPSHLYHCEALRSPSSLHASVWLATCIQLNIKHSIQVIQVFCSFYSELDMFQVQYMVDSLLKLLKWNHSQWRRFSWPNSILIYSLMAGLSVLGYV